MPTAPLSAAVRTAEALLRRWIGLDVATIGQSALERAVQARMTASGQTDPEVFADRLTADADERDRLVDEIIVAESWFFRDPQVFDVITRFATTRIGLPPPRHVRILCVPCAAGEEPYSVAMALFDAGLPVSRFTIDAVDVSHTCLGRAASASYPANSFRTADRGFRDRWFRVAGATAHLDDAVRRAVTFSWGNILSETFVTDRVPYDVIFCRNLLIYLTAEARVQVERSLDRLLKPDGMLVVGAAEPAILRGPWMPTADGSSFTLRRGPAARPPLPPRAARQPPPSAPGKGTAVDPAAPVSTRDEAVLGEAGLRPQGGAMADPFTPSAANVTAPVPDCWRTIGVSGDRSCPELAHFVHCRNCPVLAEAARTFFDRPAPDGYLESWRDVLEQPEAEGDSLATSVLVFRVGPEWLALPAAVLVEIAAPRRLHRLPHLRGAILSGLVNIRGQLQLCADLGGLLGLEHHAAPSEMAHAPQLLVVDRAGERWVFGVDEVAGVHRVPRSELRAVPSTVSAGAMPMTAALFTFQHRTVALLDETRLLDGLRGRILE